MLALTEIQLRRWNDDLLLTYGGGVANWVNTDTLTTRNVMYSLESGSRYGLDAGTRVLTLTNWYSAAPTQYLNRLMDSNGTAQGFTTLADMAPATFTGTERSEVLAGAESNDTLIGGRGNDLLTGGKGDDSYHYERGDGDDIVIDEGGSNDVIRLGAGIEIADLAVTEDVAGLRIDIGGAQGGSVLFAEWAQGSAASVDGVVLADGTHLDRTAIDAMNAGNHSPRVAQVLPKRFAQRDQPFALIVPAATFTDVDTGDSVTYSASVDQRVGLPDWLSFDAVTHTFSGTPGIADAGTTTIAVVATDSGGLSTRAVFELTVVVPIHIDGTAGRDSIVLDGQQQSHEVFGLGSDDLLWGGALADLLDGGPGNDHVVGGAGDDIVRGGDGNDNLGGDGGSEDLGNDRVYGGEGDDHLEGGPGVDQLFGEGGADTLYGTSSLVTGEMVIPGGGSAMYGGPGDDMYYVRSVLDSVIENANEGIDAVGSEHDYTLGANIEQLYLLNGDAVVGIGNDLDNELYGNAADNILVGGAGNDVLDGREGVDSLNGGAGNDTYFVDNSADHIVDTTGIDTVYSSQTYVLTVELENLVLTGPGVLNAVGNAGANFITGNGGGGTLSGGLGDDTYVLRALGNIVNELPGEGYDTVQSSVTIALSANVEDLVLTGTANVHGTGNELANRITGNAGMNTLSGGAGADVMSGGQGDDKYGVDNVGDTVIEAAGEGLDVVQASVTFTLGTNVENLTLTGTAAINGTGNGLNNQLIGNNANNILDGAGGADAQYGGQGNDTYVVDNIADLASESAGQGTDTVRAWISWTLSNNLENLTLLGADPLAASGNTLANVLTGNAGNNVLNGGSGADTLIGGAGNDTLIGGSGSDTLQGGSGDDLYETDVSGDITTENANEGIDRVNSVINWTLAANIELLFLTGTAAINGTGNALNNLLRGNAVNNSLAGGSGVDVLEGGAGNDVLSDSSGRTLLNGGEGTDSLTGTTGNDLFIGGKGNDAITTGTGADLMLFNRGDGQDTIAVNTTQDNTLSLGGGISYADLQFRRSGNNLLLLTGGSDQITFTNYYSATANRSVDRLQVVIEGSTDYRPGSTDLLRNRRVESFDFDGLVTAFDAARARNASLTTWSLSNALAAQHWGGSDTAAMGGDLAYRYGLAGTLSDLSVTPAAGLLGAAAFGSALQGFQPLSSLQDSSVRLM